MAWDGQCVRGMHKIYSRSALMKNHSIFLFFNRLHVAKLQQKMEGRILFHIIPHNIAAEHCHSFNSRKKNVQNRPEKRSEFFGWIKCDGYIQYVCIWEQLHRTVFYCDCSRSRYSLWLAEECSLFESTCPNKHFYHDFDLNRSTWSIFPFVRQIIFSIHIFNIHRCMDKFLSIFNSVH